MCGVVHLGCDVCGVVHLGCDVCGVVHQGCDVCGVVTCVECKCFREEFNFMQICTLLMTVWKMLFIPMK